MVKSLCGHKNKRCQVPLPGQEGAFFSDCYYQYQWNQKMQRLYAKEPRTMTGFSLMPKGDVT